MFDECSYECGICKKRKEDIPVSSDRPDCCGQKMWISNKSSAHIRVWNTDPATMNGAENRHYCGIE